MTKSVVGMPLMVAGIGVAVGGWVLVAGGWVLIVCSVLVGGITVEVEPGRGAVAVFVGCVVSVGSGVSVLGRAVSVGDTVETSATSG